MSFINSFLLLLNSLLDSESSASIMIYSGTLASRTLKEERKVVRVTECPRRKDVKSRTYQDYAYSSSNC